MKKLLLIVNPKSGKAKMRSELYPVVEIFSREYDVSVYITKAKGDATERVKRIEKGEFDLIVVCGGDGTLNEVVSGLMLADLSITISYIPSGTLNEWSSGLGISKTITKAASDILSGKEINLDIGKFADRYFTYTASFGAFTNASYTTNQDVKNVLGQAAYFFEGLKGISTIKPLRMKFEADGNVYEDDYVFGAISNSLSVGGIVKFQNAEVELDDGLFEVLLIKNPQNLTQLQSIVDSILKKDFSRDEIEFFHSSKITISSAKNVPWTLDGEYFKGDELIVAENLHSALHLIVPADNKTEQ